MALGRSLYQACALVIAQNTSRATSSALRRGAERHLRPFLAHTRCFIRKTTKSTGHRARPSWCLNRPLPELRIYKCRRCGHVIKYEIEPHTQHGVNTPSTLSPEHEQCHCRIAAEMQVGKTKTLAAEGVTSRAARVNLQGEPIGVLTAR